MSKKMKLIIIIIEIIVLLGLSGYRVYEYINKDSNVNENVKKYKVTFDYGDNTVRSIEVEENKKIEFTEEPIKKGYKFDGWLLNSVIIDNNYEVKGDITLKANWVNENIDSEIKILVYEINIRQEADVNSTDLGDVHMDQVYEVLDIVETDMYTWYKIKKDSVVGYVANQKGEEWVFEYGNIEQIAKNYDFIHQLKSGDYDFGDYEYILAEKDNKVVLLNMMGLETSKYYDNLFDLFGVRTIPRIPQNYSIKKNVVRYKNNGKYGLLALENGREITDAIYDDISIYQDNIVVIIDGLEYVMDANGNIKSNGYEKVLSSNDDLIIIEENDMIDIIDYEGNSKITNKINSNGYAYYRKGFYAAPVIIDYIIINFENNTITVYIPFENYFEIINSDSNKGTKYTYNIKSETLTIEEY